MVVDQSSTGGYEGASAFGWKRATLANGPEWLSQIPGVSRVEITEESGSENGHVRVVGVENIASGSLRGVAFRFRDWKGEFHFQWVPY